MQGTQARALHLHARATSDCYCWNAGTDICCFEMQGRGLQSRLAQFKSGMHDFDLKFSLVLQLSWQSAIQPEYLEVHIAVALR